MTLVLGACSAGVSNAVATTATPSAARWHLDGAFGRGGVAGLPLRESAKGSLLAPGPGGSTFVGGFARQRAGAVLVARMSASGTLVKAFGGSGVVTLPTIHWYSSSPPRLVSAGGGRLLLIGLDRTDRLTVARLDASGHLDRGFGHDGVAVYAFPHRDGFTITTAASVEPSGDVVVAYQREAPQQVNEPAIPRGLGEGPLALARILPSGALDRSFGHGGFLAVTAATPALVGYPGAGGGWACEQALAPDGSLVLSYEQALAAGGSMTPGPALQKLEPSGEDAASYGSHGEVSLPFAPRTAGATSDLCDGLFALRDGSVEAAFGGEGEDSRMVDLFRFTPTGALDTAFAGSGHVTLGAPVAALATAGGEVFSVGSSSGRLVVSGILAGGAADHALGGASGERFGVRIAGEPSTVEALGGSNGLIVRAGEELVRVTR